MTTYTSEAQAVAAGFRIVAEHNHHRFALYGQEDELLGEAHYTLLGDTTIDFDHTLVQPELRGTGLAALLARHALTSGIIGDRTIKASCSYIANYISRNPELLES